jgi:hypothetical protein
MQPMHPGMVEALMRARRADLERVSIVGLPRSAPVRTVSGRRRRAMRKQAGLLLIDIGVRLALPRRPLTPAAR